MEQRRPLRDAAAFSGITLGLSYLVFWGPLALMGIPAISFVANIRGPIWAIVLFLMGGFVPSAVAFILAGSLKGQGGCGRFSGAVFSSALGCAGTSR